eukprot:CAMPEP_0116872198 /NCGR_PEP_ID=MMETSP0463-20121206/2897_1 /TAXON_ID=181622 /ORGANISM="Strombidinopsis sp, Strain SopsisLIS2011" /LENGTH=78 /DNA_ID=CAMNT_0004512077 /DNA_START=113 /DNA_END=349 /DNA_ORIENTATION=-
MYERRNPNITSVTYRKTSEEWEKTYSASEYDFEVAFSVKFGDRVSTMDDRYAKFFGMNRLDMPYHLVGDVPMFNKEDF